MTTTKSVFRCPQCGGCARPVAGRDYLQCEYCRTLVFTSENPLAVDRITPLNAELDAACPVCETSLQQGQVDGRRVLYCGDCYGVLLRNELFGEVLRERRSRRGTQGFEAARPINHDDYERRLDCPNCSNPMEAHPYYGPGNVVMDSCCRCHLVWLDHGELSALERAEGGREPGLLPVYINSHGEATFVPPPDSYCPDDRAPRHAEKSPLALLADLFFN